MVDIVYPKSKKKRVSETKKNGKWKTYPKYFFFFFKTDGRGEGGDRRADDGDAEESGGRAELIYCWHPNIVVTQLSLSHKYFWSPNTFNTQILSGLILCQHPEIVGTQMLLTPKYYWGQMVLAPKYFWQTFFLSPYYCFHSAGRNGRSWDGGIATPRNDSTAGWS